MNNRFYLGIIIVSTYFLLRNFGPNWELTLALVYPILIIFYVASSPEKMNRLEFNLLSIVLSIPLFFMYINCSSESIEVLFVFLYIIVYLAILIYSNFEKNNFSLDSKIKGISEKRIWLIGGLIILLVFIILLIISFLL